MNIVKFISVLALVFVSGCSTTKNLKSPLESENIKELEQSNVVIQDESLNAALQLFDSIGMSKMMDELIDQVLEIEMQKNPAMAPYKKTLRVFFENHLSYKSLRIDLAEIYADHFTKSELVQLAEFNSSALGKKSMKVMPTLYRKGSELGMSRVQGNIDELTDMIKEESERIQELQSQP